jgi:hypothetical protein
VAQQTRYLGAPAKGESRPPWPLIIGAVGLGVVALVALSVRERQMQVADSTASTEVIAGPPCPTISRATFNAGQPPAAKVFDFNGATFTRQFGHANCSVVATKGGMGLGSYPVCQFSSPALLAVTTKRGVVYYGPGLGRKASVSVRGGLPACVMAAPYWD